MNSITKQPLEQNLNFVNCDRKINHQRHQSTHLGGYYTLDNKFDYSQKWNTDINEEPDEDEDEGENVEDEEYNEISL